ncbi:MAG: hypothetical protein AB1941_00860 [Gemmatimonadota bacterium]
MYKLAAIAEQLRAAGIPVREVKLYESDPEYEGEIVIPDADAPPQWGPSTLNVLVAANTFLLGAVRHGAPSASVRTFTTIEALLVRLRGELGIAAPTPTLTAREALDEVLARVYRADWRAALAVANAEGHADDRPLSAGSAYCFGDVRRWAAALP